MTIFLVPTVRRGNPYIRLRLPLKHSQAETWKQRGIIPMTQSPLYPSNSLFSTAPSNAENYFHPHYPKVK